MIYDADSSTSVLLVDADPKFAGALAAVLERDDERFNVETATAPSDAHTRLADRDVDCIVAADTLPGQDGFEFLEAVRADYPELPFILYSKSGSESVAGDGIVTGVTGYLQQDSETRPETELAGRIRTAVADRRGDRRVADPEPPRESPPVADEQNKPNATGDATTDGTDQRRFTWDGNQELARIEQALETLDDVFYIVGADGELLRWNSRLVETTGYNDDALRGMDCVDLVPPEEASRVRAAIDEVLETGEAVLESTLLTADGDRIPYEFTGARLTDPLGEQPGIVGVGREITDRKAHERRLTALHEVAADLTTLDTVEAVCRRTIEASQEILKFDLSVITIEKDGVLEPIALSENIDIDGMTKMSVDEGIAGRTYRTGESFLIDDVQQHPAANPQGPYRGAISVPIGDHGNFQAVADEPGAFDESDLELAELLITHTENALSRIEREQQLANRNQQLEEFASVVSHDLRNPLSVAKGRLELASEDCDSEHLSPAAAAVDRSLDLIADLLTLAREGNRVSDLEGVSLEAVAGASWSNVETAEATLNVETTRSVRADRSQLKQIFENLMRNAVEHGGDAVTVTIGELDDGFYVEDTGPGIPAEHRETVFEAGYSSSAEGTGFGLSIVEKIAVAHDWQLRLVEAEPQGARFEFRNVEWATDSWPQ